MNIKRVKDMEETSKESAVLISYLLEVAGEVFTADFLKGKDLTGLYLDAIYESMSQITAIDNENNIYLTGKKHLDINMLREFFKKSQAFVKETENFYSYVKKLKHIE